MAGSLRDGSRTSHQVVADCLSDYYVERFSSAIDAQLGRLPEEQRAQALKIAQEWDYATPAERQETQDWNAEHGYCSHGIEFGYCPAGCDRDDDDWDLGQGIGSFAAPAAFHHPLGVLPHGEASGSILQEASHGLVFLSPIAV